MAISRDDFFTAVANGDIATLDAYFAQDHVQTQVDETEAHIIAHRGGPRGTPWYHKLTERIRRRLDRSGYFFSIAINCRQVEVVNWFFSRTRATTMGNTLAFLLPAIGFCALEAGSFGQEILEIVLCSVVFTELLSPTRQRRVLHNILTSPGRGMSATAMELLISHGAPVDVPIQEPLMRMAGSPRSHYHAWASVGLVDILVQHGAVVVGSKALTFQAYYDNRFLTRRLLELGAVDASGDILIALARQRRKEDVTLALEAGFADVDARTADGVTALMAALHDFPYARIYSIDIAQPIETVQILLAYGADVRLRDATGRTALDFAVESGLSDVVDILSTID